MPYTDEASKVIVSAEAGLRSLAEKALADRSYGDVARIASLADALRELSQRAHVIVDAPQSARPSSALPNSRPANRPGTQRSRARTHAPRGYPRFEQDGDKLVKIGWSKKAREEYEHRAPLAVANQLVSAIRAKVADGEQFTAVDILPLTASDGSGSVPDYQAYLTLKWLHSQAVVLKYGRNRYAIQPGKMDEGALDRLWFGLPKFEDAAK